MNKKVEEFVNAIGAMSEMVGIMREHLMRNGFTREEAVDIVKAYIIAVMTGDSGSNGGKTDAEE